MTSVHPRLNGMSPGGVSMGRATSHTREKLIKRVTFNNRDDDLREPESSQENNK